MGDHSDHEGPPLLFQTSYNSRACHIAYYHNGLTKPVECDRCQKIYSSVSALSRHRRTNMRCVLSRMRTELGHLLTDNSVNTSSLSIQRFKDMLHNM